MSKKILIIGQGSIAKSTLSDFEKTSKALSDAFDKVSKEVGVFSKAANNEYVHKSKFHK